jgi:ubiquinone/menaquinone biosynthesis C-methylase UbiE
LSFLEDARRDMAKIRVPVTWVHGRFDAWVDLARVQALLCCGDIAERRLLDFPMGHQLRSSAEALSAFRFIAGEVSRMSLGRVVEATPPDLEALGRQRVAERERLPRVGRALRPFWRDYLLGRDGGLGIEILTATETYRDFMAEQTALLGLREGQRVADLGAGTGDFYVELAEGTESPRGLHVHAVDFVPEALARGVARLQSVRRNGGIRVSAVAADLDCSARTPAIPLASRTLDAVLASLLLSYVRDPEALLAEVHRILRPGGTLVVSTLRRDADISKIYVDSLAERYSERPREVFGAHGAEDVDRSLPHFLNSASHIIDLEERGRFRFFDPGELNAMLEASGFADPEVSRGLGDPPQAVLVKARRR